MALLTEEVRVGLVEDVKRYYREAGVSPMEFRCAHSPECMAGCPDFAPAREPYIGAEYEQGTLPRLLFLSLDAGSIDDPDPSLRTAEWLRAWEEKRFQRDERLWWREGRHYCRHWRATYEMARQLLTPFKPALTVYSVGPYFAHTNSAKCCMNNDGRRVAGRRLFHNCREVVQGELLVLRPDILVTQGGWAKEVVMRSFAETSGSRSGANSARIRLGSGEVLWLHSYHPSAYGRFRAQSLEREEWAQLAREFITEQG